MKKLLIMISITALLAGCTTLYSSIVTITEIRKSAMNELGALQRQGKISAETDAKIAQADATYRAAAERAEKALIAYKDGAQTDETTAAIKAVKEAVSGILDILAPFISQSEAVTYQTKLSKAQKL